MERTTFSEGLSEAADRSASPSLPELLSAVRDGDEQALNQLFRVVYPRVSRILRPRMNTLIRSFYDDSDLSGEVWKTLVGNFRDLEFGSLQAFTRFLVVVTEQHLTDAYRRARALELVRSSSQYPAMDIAENEDWGVRRVQRVFESTGEEVDSAAEISQRSGRRKDNEQAQARLAEFRDEWYRVGICTQPADRPRAEAAIALMYASLGAPPPRFVWCDSPMTAQLVLHSLRGSRSLRQQAVRHLLQHLKREELGDGAEASLGAWLGNTLQTSVKVALQDSLGGTWMKDTTPPPGQNVLLTAAAASLRSLLWWDQPRTRVRSTSAPAPVESSGWGSLRARNLLESALEETLRGTLEALKLPYRETSLRGQQESLWIEGFLFFRDVLGIPDPPRLADRLDWWADVARSCLWWWPYRGVCIVSERPAEIHTSDEERIHNHAGPAVRFRDGWSIWAIGGVVVDEQLVLRPETQSVPQIRRERNAELKRLRIERFGWDRYLGEVGAIAIDRRRNDVEATRETLFRTPDRERILVCACPSTARVYALAVPQDIRTCEAAQAWLSGGLAGRIINGA